MKKLYLVEEVDLNDRNEITGSWDVKTFDNKEEAIEFAKEWNTQCDSVLVTEFDVIDQFEDGEMLLDNSNTIAEYKKGE